MHEYLHVFISNQSTTDAADSVFDSVKFTNLCNTKLIIKQFGHSCRNLNTSAVDYDINIIEIN